MNDVTKKDFEAYSNLLYHIFNNPLPLDYEIILFTRFGSHLYGTNTENSDSDYKGIFINRGSQKTPKTITIGKDKNPGEKNTPDDIDIQLFNLEYFFELLQTGDITSFDILHTNKENTLITSDIWKLIQKNKSIFYSKNLTSLVGYVKKQASKYGIKGSRLYVAEKFVNLLDKFDAENRMNSIWPDLPISEYSNYIEGKELIQHYIICGKIIQDTVKIGYAKRIVQNYIDKFGERAKMARNNNGVDWKALSHAIRASFQYTQIMVKGDIEFPLVDAEFLKLIKLGEYEYSFVADVLEKSIETLNYFAKVSNLPENINKKEVDGLLKEILLIS